MINFFDRARNMLYEIATYNIGGNHMWGGIIVSACAFPLILLGRMLYRFSVDSFYTISMFSFLCFLGALQLILESVPGERRYTIVINRLLGMLICYYYIPLQLKFIIIATLLYHALRSVVPHIILSKWQIDITAHSGLLGSLGLDIATGVTANICMHFVRLFVA